ncbi:MAG TPA: NAD(P)/FAD-dependent oxidoreductase [Bacillota bacterium]|nr:NAD(P)/FAD-dependent oxidoreductase [Bacillota bacterium]
MKIGIVGGGFTGLTAGYELAKQGHQVVVYEQLAECGGLVSVTKVGDVALENFYHHIFTSDQELVDLIEELGLGSRMHWLTPYNSTYINGKFYSLNTPGDLLRFKELPFIERIRMGLLILRSWYIKNWSRLEKCYAKDWVYKNAGKQAYEKFWGPLLYSKFDSDADRVAAVWLWNKFKLRGSTRSKNLNKELLGYFNGSFGTITQELIKKITGLGGQIRCNTTVTQIAPQPGGAVELTAGASRETFDRVIVTTAPDLLLEMKVSFPEEYQKKLSAIKYKANICMTLELSQPLSPYYWITVTDNRVPFVAVIEHTNLVKDPGYGSHIVYLSRYLDESNELYWASDQVIRTKFLTDLKKMFPAWNESTLKNCRISRVRYAQPVVITNYSKILPPFETPIKNLYLACMAQIYPEDRGQNYAVRMGKEIAKIVGS